LPIARHDSAAACTSKPMIATTTRSSRSVKPALATRAERLLEVPIADVGIDAFTTFLAIRAVREHVEIAAALTR